MIFNKKIEFLNAKLVHLIVTFINSVKFAMNDLFTKLTNLICGFVTHIDENCDVYFPTVILAGLLVEGIAMRKLDNRLVTGVRSYCQNHPGLAIMAIATTAVFGRCTVHVIKSLPQQR